MANPFVRTAGQLTFAWSLVGIELEILTSHIKLKLGNKRFIRCWYSISPEIVPV